MNDTNNISNLDSTLGVSIIRNSKNQIVSYERTNVTDYATIKIKTSKKSVSRLSNIIEVKDTVIDQLKYLNTDNQPPLETTPSEWLQKALSLHQINDETIKTNPGDPAGAIKAEFTPLTGKKGLFKNGNYTGYTMGKVSQINVFDTPVYFDGSTQVFIEHGKTYYKYFGNYLIVYNKSSEPVSFKLQKKQGGAYDNKDTWLEWEQLPIINVPAAKVNVDDQSKNEYGLGHFQFKLNRIKSKDFGSLKKKSYYEDHIVELELVAFDVNSGNELDRFPIRCRLKNEHWNGYKGDEIVPENKQSSGVGTNSNAYK